MHVLMLSSSRAGNEDYLSSASQHIKNHLGEIKNILFVPYAGVSISWHEYTAKVKLALPNYEVSNIADFSNPVEAVNRADAILVGGGNTFNLLACLYKHDLLKAIQNMVNSGTPYIGWSAGANICGDSIRTTNDMPIIEPPSFNALKLVPFQLNPHYTEYQAPGHNGETRSQRIEEFCALNPDMPVIGIPEGTALIRHGNNLHYVGEENGVIFKGNNKNEITTTSQLSQYI